MYHFFSPGGPETDGFLTITGPDVKHITRVLRMKEGERLIVSDDQDRNRLCEIAACGPDFVRVRVLEEEIPSAEMDRRVILFQGLPKGDKMDYIISRSVELGAAGLVPVEMARSVVKLEPKKKESRRERWQAKAESAAKQSGRGVIPEIGAVCRFADAVKQAQELDVILVPYESAEKMAYTRSVLGSVPAGASVGIFIGPEGGFAPEEIEELTRAGGKILTLGPRILRTEAAGAAVLAMCTLLWED